jgi:hypothetical protein
MGISMTATTIVKQAQALLQVTMILISIGLVPVMVGMLGRSDAPNQVVAADLQTGGPVFQW